MKSGTLAATALLVVACAAATGGSATAKGQPTIGFVTYSGVVPTQRTLDGQMLRGFLRAEKKLAVRGRVVLVSPTADPTEALSYLGRQHYDLVIVALPRADVVFSVAREFPRVRFFIVDAPVHGPKHQPKNVQGSIYRAEEAGYLAGYLAALMEGRTSGKHEISAVGGVPYEGVNRWTVGYKAGAMKADPTIDVNVGYSKDFANPAKCRRVALRQIAEGSGVVFNVAGACGLGTLGAAKDEGVWGVGVDVDQSYLGPQMLASAIIKQDWGVFTIVQQFVQGRLATDRPTIFGLRNGGVGLASISPRVPPAFLRRVESIRNAIVGGRIRVPRP
jgi:basic membrane protein A and related proteins